MAERYTRLFTLPQSDLYLEGSPVILSTGVLLKDNQTGNVLAQLKFQNVSPKAIRAIKVALINYDSFGTELEGVPEFQYLDLDARRDAFFGPKNAILLPSRDTRSFTCDCTCVIFTDGTVWTAPEGAWTPLKPQKALEEALGTLVDQYRRDTGAREVYLVQEDRDLWRCACGAINRQGERACHACHAERQLLLNAADPELLREHLAAYEQEQAEKAAAQAAREAAEKARQKAKQKKGARIAVPLALVVALAGLFFGWLWPDVIQPSRQYKQAQALLDAGEYEAAAAAFDALLDYKDSADMCVYADALSSYQAGDRETALSLFRSILDLQDSRSYAAEIEEKILVEKYQAVLSAAEKSNTKQVIAMYAEAEAFLANCVAYKEDPANELALESKYAYGTMLEKRERYEEAASVFSELGDYKNSAEKRQSDYFKSPAGLYEQAVQCEEKGDWVQAAALFEKAGSYQDASERRKAAIYQNGVQFYESGQYYDAIRLFSKIKEYKDADRYLQASNLRNVSSLKTAANKADTLANIVVLKLTAEDLGLYHEACYSLGQEFEKLKSYADAFKWYKLSGINDYEQRMKYCNQQYIQEPFLLSPKGSLKFSWGVDQKRGSNGIIQKVTYQKSGGSIKLVVHLTGSVAFYAKRFDSSHRPTCDISVYTYDSGFVLTEKAMSQSDQSNTISLVIPVSKLEQYKKPLSSGGYSLMIWVPYEYDSIYNSMHGDSISFEYTDLAFIDLYGNAF